MNTRLRSLVRRARSRWEPVDQAAYLVRLQQRVGLKSPVLVYSLGKVGTTSLEDVIERSTRRPTIRCHSVTPAGTRRDRADTVPGSSGRAVTWRGEYVRWRIRLDRTHRWEVVCGVRDPMARIVSTMFQIGGISLCSGAVNDGSNLDSLTDRVVSFFEQGRTGLRWFEEELRAVSGIDVYSHPFDTACGWQSYDNGRFRVLLIRYEDLPAVGTDALQHFFGLSEKPTLRALNVGGEKPYGSIYRTFVAHASFPTWVLDAAYESIQARHFYTDSERRALRERWEATDAASR